MVGGEQSPSWQITRTDEYTEKYVSMKSAWRHSPPLDVLYRATGVL